jgi:hypothetical protein
MIRDREWGIRVQLILRSFAHRNPSLYLGYYPRKNGAAFGKIAFFEAWDYL